MNHELLQHCPECRQLWLGPEQELLQGSGNQEWQNTTKIIIFQHKSISVLKFCLCARSNSVMRSWGCCLVLVRDLVPDCPPRPHPHHHPSSQWRRCCIKLTNEYWWYWPMRGQYWEASITCSDPQCPEIGPRTAGWSPHWWCPLQSHVLHHFPFHHLGQLHI